MKIIIVHDSLIQYGGAERVVKGLCEAFPDAPLHVLAKSDSFKGANAFSNTRIYTSPLQRIMRFLPSFKYTLFVMPAIIRTWRLPQCDVVISSSSLLLKGLKLPGGVKHIAYTHTPPRFLWTEPEYIVQEVPSLLRPLVRFFLYWLKKYDFDSAQKPDVLVANSVEVAHRIKRIYNRETFIINAFIDTDFWKPTVPKGDYFLVAGRLVKHKDFDKVITAFNDLQIPLVVAGTGAAESELQKIAGPNIRFTGWVSDENLRDLYSGAKGFMYPQFEDFGLMPLEAAACGTASLALAKGGSLETVISGKTGLLIEDMNPETIKSAVSLWEESTFTQQALLDHSQKFSKTVFTEKIINLVQTTT